MEAIIRINDKDRFNSLIKFLKSLSFEVEVTNNDVTPVDYVQKMSLEEYNNKLNEAEIAYKSGKTFSHDDLKDEVAKWKNKNQ